MNKIRSFLLFVAIVFATINPVFGATPAKINHTVPEYLLVRNFVHYTPSEFEAVSGHKLGLTQKLFFKKLQRQLKKADLPLEANLLPYFNEAKGKFKFNSLWFVLGLLIGPFGLLFSYTVKHKSKEEAKNSRISALIGMGVFFIWFGFIFLF